MNTQILMKLKVCITWFLFKYDEGLSVVKVKEDLVLDTGRLADLLEVVLNALMPGARVQTLHENVHLHILHMVHICTCNL